MAEAKRDKSDFDVSLELKDHALASTAEGITISDYSRSDNPLIYVNKGFEVLTGYPAESVLGRNCRFLQGRNTNPETMKQIRESIKAEKPCMVEILNYRKDGSKFWNRLSITPVKDKSGKTSHFIGVQSDITARREAEEALKAANERMKEDLDAGAEVQKALLPHILPNVKNIEFAWRFKPCAQLAGDFLNIVKLDEKHIAVYVIDVSGHGVSASLLAVTVSKLLSSAAFPSVLFQNQDENSPQQVIAPPKVVAERLNSYFQFSRSSSKFFTMVYGILNTDDYSFDYVCVGHPPPYILSTGKKPVMLYDEQFPIGVVDKPEYDQRTVKLEAGDKMVLYTDGVTEACNHAGDAFGEARLEANLSLRSQSSLEELVSAVVEEVESWSGGENFKDDVSMLAFQRLAKD